MTLLVGLGHRSGAGKDTVADALAERYGFWKYSFANALKLEVLERFPDVLGAVAREMYGHDSLLSREELVWSLKPPVVRALLQNYGTEVRRADDPQYWIDRLHARIFYRERPARAVVTDVRFQNEVEWVRRAGGWLVRVDRGAVLASAHASEQELAGYAGWDYVLGNFGTLGDLDAEVDRAAAALGIAAAGG